MALLRRPKSESTNSSLTEREEHFRSWEWAVWFVVALVIPFRFWWTWIYGVGFIDFDIWEEIPGFSLDILASFSVLMFPILYQLIFGLLPFESVRLGRDDRRDQKAKTRVPPPGRPISPPVSFLLGSGLKHDSNPQEILAALVKASGALSSQIFKRAGIYLIVGVIVAFIGLLFFYIQSGGESGTIQPTGEPNWLRTLTENLAPRFGILFFVEFIAFFFLRQYRSAMEEFRYFEAIQRKREEVYVLIRLMKKEGGKVDIDRLIKGDSFFSGVDRLAAGESTELLESKKLTKDEMDVFTKIIEAVSRSKA